MEVHPPLIDAESILPSGFLLRGHKRRFRIAEEFHFMIYAVLRFHAKRGEALEIVGNEHDRRKKQPKRSGDGAIRGL
jgi:hypothetical protein